MRDWSGVKKLLCIRLDSIGDVLMTSPAIRALKTSAENREITLLTSPNGLEAAGLIPEIDRVIGFEAPWMKASRQPEDSSGLDMMVAQLKREKYQGAVIFTVYSQSSLPAALLTFLAEIPNRLAYCRENPYYLLTDWIAEKEPESISRHEVQRQLDLVQEIGSTATDHRIRLAIPEDADLFVKGTLPCEIAPGAGDWIVIHPGASAPSRRYDPEKFAQVCRDLFIRHGIRTVFTGSASEVDLVLTIQKRSSVPSVSMAGKLDLVQMASLLRMAPLLLSNNSGPVHIAAGVGTPVVDMYALTNPQHTPWRVPNIVLNHDVPCKYCYKSVCPLGHQNCLQLVPPEQVIQAVLQLIGKKKMMPMTEHTSNLRIAN